MNNVSFVSCISFLHHPRKMYSGQDAQMVAQWMKIISKYLILNWAEFGNNCHLQFLQKTFLDGKYPFSNLRKSIKVFVFRRPSTEFNFYLSNLRVVEIAKSHNSKSLLEVRQKKFSDFFTNLFCHCGRILHQNLISFVATFFVRIGQRWRSVVRKPTSLSDNQSLNPAKGPIISAIDVSKRQKNDYWTLRVQ